MPPLEEDKRSKSRSKSKSGIQSRSVPEPNNEVTSPRTEEEQEVRKQTEETVPLKAEDPHDALAVKESAPKQEQEQSSSPVPAPEEQKKEETEGGKEESAPPEQ